MLKRILLTLFLLILLLAWAPWLSRDTAQRKAEQAFETAWEGVADGCGLNCDNCGAKEAQKTLLGYAVRLEYACGLLPADLPEYHQTVRVYVSPLGTVHGFSRP